MNNSVDRSSHTKISTNASQSTSVSDTEQGAPQVLTEDDQRRVEQYLASPIHSIERKPFRPFVMMLSLVAIVSSLSLLSLAISWLVLG